MRARSIAAGAAFIVMAAPGFGVAGLYWRVSNPTAEAKPLPAELIALDTPEGQALLAGAEARVDADALLPVLQRQEKRTWCGVASAATVLSAIEGRAVSHIGAGA